MKNIEIDLLKILKSKSKDELFYVVLNMVNNTYEYELDYLKLESYDTKMNALNKIMELVLDKKDFDKIEDALLYFCDNLDKLPEKALKPNTFTRIKNYIMQKDNFIRTSALILIWFVTFSSSKNFALSKNNDNSPRKEYGIERKIVMPNYTESHIKKNMTVGSREFREKELTNQEKEALILEKYNLTQEEFDIICAISLREAKANSYEDAYAVINTIYNRTKSKLWHQDLERLYGEGAGNNLYLQATMPGQFVVYEDGVYKEKLGIKEGDAYQAVIDFLYTEEVMHDYVAFRASYVDVKGSQQFVEMGNNYFKPLTEEELINRDKMSR